MIRELPLDLVIVAVWTYWICVLIMVARSRFAFRAKAGAVPQTGRERRMWMIWVPVIALWNLLPSAAANWIHPLFALPQFMLNDHPAVRFIQWTAASGAIMALILTIPCWLSMGQDWSMAVIPSKETRLITQGVFARTRHPIYSLSMLLMIATVLAAPTAAMLIVAAIHLCMLHVKARSEETHLRELHGRRYDLYCEQTCRFFPRLALTAANNR